MIGTFIVIIDNEILNFKKMKHSKNLYSIIVVLLLMPFLLFCTACKQKSKNETKAVKACVVFPATIDAFERLKQGMIEICKDSIELKFYSAEGDPSKFETVIQNALLENPDYLVTIGTQMTNTAFAPKFESKLKTVIAGAISSPELVESLVNVGLHPKRTRPVAIISDSPKEDIYLLLGKTIKGVLQNIKSVGIIYNTAEINSKETAARIIDAVKPLGIVIEDGVINNAEDIEKIVGKLLLKNVDAIVIPHDKYAVTKASSIVKRCMDRNIPVFSLDDGTVRKNDVAVGVSVSYTIIGKLIGNVLIDINSGKAKAEDLPIISMDNAQIYINPTVLKKLNLTIPEVLTSLIEE